MQCNVPEDCVSNRLFGFCFHNCGFQCICFSLSSHSD
jgi:hypothetical protein